jgi:GNAT superfamily N-acetyltransferase
MSYELNRLLKFRRITLRDFNRIENLYNEFREFSLDRDSLKRAVRNYPSCVATQGRELVGFAYCWRFGPKVAELANIYVKKGYRNEGIGSQFIGMMIDQAADLGLSAILAINSVEPEPSQIEPKYKPIGFYEKHNFSKVYSSEVTDIYIRALDGLVCPTDVK